MCINSQSGVPTYQQHPLGAETQIPGPPPDQCFTKPSMWGGGSELSGGCDCRPPLPGVGRVGLGPPGAFCSQEGRGGPGETAVGVRAGKGLPLPGGEARGRPEAAGAPGPSRSWADKGRGCPLKGGVGTPRGEFRRRSSGGRRRENGCRAVELLSPDEADRPGYRGVSKSSRGPLGDPNA